MRPLNLDPQRETRLQHDQDGCRVVGSELRTRPKKLSWMPDFLCPRPTLIAGFTEGE
jgi:hypothetical protein